MENQPEHYSADKPISNQIQDRFQRFEFSKRIAQTIKQRESDESIVFGLFGAWGEGKSSVINFIDGELSKDDSIIIIHLNPWRYTDEESLLFNFFNRIARALDRQLQNKKEKLAGFVEKYGGVAKIFGIDNNDVSKAIADTNLEEFKERVDSFLSESSQKLVVFIDDIDRLDKQEISTLFRLIKLTADFSKTTYILSFDESMVAASIGERFGNGDIKAGENFLEKIIQVPLTIPKAQPEALKKFCFDILDNSLKTNNIQLKEEEINRFVYQFTSYVLGRLETPRLAVRYGNAVSFSLPLLLGEVNTVDLMLVEALKVFYPDYYRFVKDYPNYFISSYNNGSLYGGRGLDQKKVDVLKDHLGKLGEPLKKRQSENAEELLSKLFPVVGGVLANNSYERGYRDSWKKEKRICSAAYFDRYFSYSVIEGDISDVEFNFFIETLVSAELEEIMSSLNNLSSKSSLLKVIEKLQTNSEDLVWESFKNLATAICRISFKLENKNAVFSLGMDSSLRQAEQFIYRELERNKDKSDLFDLSQKLIENCSTVEFIVELIYWFNTDEAPLFSPKQLKTFEGILVQKALSMVENSDNLIDRFPEDNRLLLRTWYRLNKSEAKKYVQHYLKSDKKNAISLLWVFTPVITSTSQPKPYKGDLSEDGFKDISDYVSHNALKRQLSQLFNKTQLNEHEVSWDGRRNGKNNDINLVRQYLFRYHQLISKAGTNSTK